jgi:hypothetical protein
MSGDNAGIAWSSMWVGRFTTGQMVQWVEMAEAVVVEMEEVEVTVVVVEEAMVEGAADINREQTCGKHKAWQCGTYYLCKEL